jgi:hypothetical protein
MYCAWGLRKYMAREVKITLKTGFFQRGLRYGIHLFLFCPHRRRNLSFLEFSMQGYRFFLRGKA